MHFLILVSILFSTTLLAKNNYISKIHLIDEGNRSEAPLIFLKNGKVLELKSRKMLQILKDGLRKKSWFRFDLNRKNQAVSINEVPEPKNNFLQKLHSPFMESTPFVPTIIKDIEMAKKLFEFSRKDDHANSQCFDRAHIWSYEWRKNYQLYSSKAWLFFTQKFIRKYKFGWWFHVAPTILVVHQGKVKERVMDIKYARGPLPLKAWTDIFIRDLSGCPVVTKYSDYADYPESGSCFLLKSSMYYYMPIDLENLEEENVVRNRWVFFEVQQAYREAYNVEF
jgi:hypothetical protein